MAFTLANLAPAGNQSRRGKSPQHFVYRTTDSLATIEASGYFDDASAMLSLGDTIYAQVVDDLTTPTSVSADAMLRVAGNSSGVVTTAVQTGSKVYLTAYLADVSTASSAWTVSPVAGKVTKIYSVLHGAITGADSTVTAKIGGVAITDGALTIANAGSAAGDVDSATPTAANTVTAGQAIEFATDGGSTNAIPLDIIVEITP